MDDNDQLNQQNIDLKDQLQSEQVRVQSSLLPQYQEAFEQMRITNEML